MSRPAPLVRLDSLLVQRGLAASRERARELVEQGGVQVDGLPATKAGTRVRADSTVALRSSDHPWVSRGALKLLPALDEMGVDVRGLVAADFGASTGGFTEVLLERGVQRVYAIDVGRGQLAWKLRTDARVVVLEGTNVRHLETLPEPLDLVVGDLSFISLALVLPAIRRLLQPEGRAVVLVKPQFEAGREAVGKGGRVRHESDRIAAIEKVRGEAEAGGFDVLAGIDCVLAGAKAGNVEHFLLLRVRPIGRT